MRLPKVVRSFELVVCRIISTRYSLPTIHWRRRRLGFSLIELLIVISLFGLAASLITAAYLTFERNQKVKNAALTLKNDIRLVQNKAHTGDKGPDKLCQISAPSNLDVELFGWFVTFAKNTNTYKISAFCKKISSGLYTEMVDKIVTLPDGITVSDITIGGGSIAFNSVNVLFQPLTADARFYNDQFTVPEQFITGDGTEPNRFGQGSTLNLMITGGGGNYNVDITSNGEVNERR